MKTIILITFIFFIIIISGQKIEFAEDKKERCTQLQKEITDLSDTDIIEKAKKMLKFSTECLLTSKESIEQTNKINNSLAKQDAERKAKIQPIIDQINNGICVPCKNDKGEDTCKIYVLGDVICPRKKYKNCVTSQECTNGICKNGFCILAGPEDIKKDITYVNEGLAS